MCFFPVGVGNLCGPWLPVQGCAPNMARLGGRSMAAAGFGLQMVGKEAQACPPPHKAVLTIEHFPLRYESSSKEEDDSPGREQPR